MPRFDPLIEPEPSEGGVMIQDDKKSRKAKKPKKPPKFTYAMKTALGYEDQLEAVGRAIFAASVDPQALEALQKDPVKFLTTPENPAGKALLPNAALAGRTVNVLVDKTESQGGTVHVVVPEVDQSKKDDKDYMKRIGFITIMGCR